jgi:hypothetical protein
MVWAREGNRGTLLRVSGSRLHEVDANLAIRALDDAKTRDWMTSNLAVPRGVLQEDRASIVYTDEDGRRWRLPRGNERAVVSGRSVRVDREVSTERDLFNAAGIFYELPSNNAGGIAMVRPIATHNLDIDDYCSWRGLAVLSVSTTTDSKNERLVRTPDRSGALWLGVSDELWELGKSRGVGGPWLDSSVRAGAPSDPYLMIGFSDKTLRVRHHGAATLPVRIEIDVTGTGLWMPYATFDVPPGEGLVHRFPDGFAAYWLRAVALRDAQVTVQLEYR